MGVYKIKTPRLYLRPLIQEDAEAMFALASDPEVSRYLTWVPHQSLEHTCCFISGAIGANKMRKLPVMFGVFERKTNELVGFQSFVSIDLRTKKAEVGMWFGKKFWGKGYSTEVYRMFLNYGFGVLGLKRVLFQARVANIASWKVAEKLGFAYRGTVEHERDGKMKQYTMTREMWEHQASSE